MKDSQGNVIEVTLFESYLSKYLIENPKFFEPVYQKILTAIQEIETLNQSNNRFNRVMFSIYSLLLLEFEEFKNIQDLKDNFNLFAANHFIRVFSDNIVKTNLITVFQKQEFTKRIPSLSVLCQHTLFKQSSDNNLLIPFLKPKKLFHENNRGVTLIKDADSVSTNKLGIATIETTPKDLLMYFPEAHYPAQFDYTPNRLSNVGRWMTQYNLPLISGSSGTARDYLSTLFCIIKLEPNEIQLMIISLAATLVAKGHHSYFEVIILLDRIGFKLQSSTNLLELYEQTLPKCIRLSESYIQFKNSDVGANLLDTITIDLSHDCECEELPSFRLDS